MVRQIQQEHAQAQVELWCMDEHRAGLRTSAAAYLGAERASPRRTT
jgi:hypothetical protein